MQNMTVMMGQQTVKLTPELEKSLEKLNELVKSQENKKPDFKNEDKDKLTAKILEKIELE